MAELMRFSAFAVRQALVIAGGTKAEEVFDWLQEYSSDPHQALPRAVARASEQTWQAVELALLDSSGLRARLQVAFAPGVVKGLAAPLRQLVAERDPAFREGCRRELAQLQRSSATDLSWQQAAASFPHLQQPEELLKQARMVLAEEVAVMRTSGLEYLPELIALELPQQGGPLLLHLFNSFLRAEVMGSPELSQALSFSFLETLSEQQVQVLGLLDEILERLPKSPWGRAEMFRCPPRSAPRASSEVHCDFRDPRPRGPLRYRLRRATRSARPSSPAMIATASLPRSRPDPPSSPRPSRSVRGWVLAGKRTAAFSGSTPDRPAGPPSPDRPRPAAARVGHVVQRG